MSDKRAGLQSNIKYVKNSLIIWNSADFDYSLSTFFLVNFRFCEKNVLSSGSLRMAEVIHTFL